MDVDLAKALAARTKRDVRIELTDWNLAQERVLNGEADGLLGMSISAERRKSFDFADPMFTREFGLLVREGRVAIRRVGDLKGRKVGVTPGGFPKKFLEARPGIHLILIGNYQDGYERLQAGTIDALAADLWVAAYLMEENHVRGVSFAGKPFAKAEAAIAVKKGNFDLVGEFNRAIASLEADGTLSQIRENWRPQEIVFASRAKVRGIVNLVAGVFLLILCAALAAWIVTLRNQIQIRKKAELALRLSEGRFQLAVRGSTDGLWDRNLSTDEVYFSDRYRELLGYSAEDFPGTFASFESCLHPDEKAEVLKKVAAHLEQRQLYDAEYRLRTKSGEYRWFRGRGQAVWDNQGRAIRMAGSITDITARKQTEERIHLLQTITMNVATASDLASALEVVLRSVCEKTGWALGQAWVPNSDGTALDCCPAWFASPASLENFRALSREASFQPGVGLPGRAWASRQPMWVQDATQDSNFPRAAAASANGLKAGLAVPILAGEEVIAVLEFFLTEPRKEDEQLVKVIAAVAAQIGLVIDRKRIEESLRKNEELFRAIVEDQSEMIVRWKPDGTRTFVNAAYCRIFGGNRDQFVGTSFFPLISEQDREAVQARIHALTPTNPVSTGQHRSLSSDGELLWQEWTDRGRFDSAGHLVELQSTGRDITRRKRAEELIHTQRHALEMIASGRPMAETLDALLQMIEAQAPAMCCSVLLLDPDGIHVRHLAAPSLPADYIKAIDGSAIGPNAGSCGTAAHRREPVFVTDIEHDPLWTNYRQFALPHSLRACWSTPIFDSHGKVIGTFAIYYRRCGLPDERHQKLISMATHTAAVCIAKHRMDEALRESEERFRAVVENSPVGVAVSVDDLIVYVNAAGLKIMGAQTPGQLIGRSVYSFTTPELYDLMRERRRQVMEHGLSFPPIEAPLLKLDGSTVHVESQASPFVYAGKPAILNLIRDISLRKQAEEALRKAQEKELLAREEFSRRLLAAQEQERQRLANELHDSLGQSLSLIKNRAFLAREKTDAAPTHLEAITRLVTDGISEVRNLVHNLRPLHIEQVGLTDSLRGLIQEVSQSTDIRFEQRVENLDDVLRGEAATHVYRIVQEALNNLVKHSQATQAALTLERDVHSVHLRIADDGTGFDVQKEMTDGGLGLTSLAERARILGGVLKIESAPGAGTQLTVELPISGPEEDMPAS
jgi:PAS domain S-box-containing protein